MALARDKTGKQQVMQTIVLFSWAHAGRVLSSNSVTYLIIRAVVNRRRDDDDDDDGDDGDDDTGTCASVKDLVK